MTRDPMTVRFVDHDRGYTFVGHARPRPNRHIEWQPMIDIGQIVLAASLVFVVLTILILVMA